MSTLMYVCTILFAATAVLAQLNAGLPVVDLGYVLQRATAFNATSNVYDFSNIRYAQAPVGELRFRGPRSPNLNRSIIQTGEEGHICFQAIPTWFELIPNVTPQMLEGEINSTYVDISEHPTPLLPTQVLPAIPHESEDCLFLDVHVPVDTFNNRDNGDGVAVVVWIHGGGLVYGWKDQYYDPTGLLAQSKLQTGKEVIFVALNYRLGALGFSGGPSVQSDGTANAGLLDQRLALDWVQKNIRSFGGDPKKVTVVGESAGAYSILGHLTAYGGGQGLLPFQQALTQSSYGFAHSSSSGELTFQSFLKIANVTSIQDARKLLGEELRVANVIQVSGSTWGTAPYAFVMDGSYVPDQPIRLLLDGNVHKEVHVMQGHNADEGLIFTPPYAQSTSGFDTFVSTLVPSKDITQVTQTLYPAIFDGSQGYKNNLQRAALMVSDFEFVCSDTALTRAVNNCSYNYIFTVPPSLHAGDVNSTFYTGSPQPQSPDARAAVDLQRWVTSFAVEGQPAALGTPVFEPYGADGMVQTVGLTGVEREADPAVAKRCDFWFGSMYA